MGAPIFGREAFRIQPTFKNEFNSIFSKSESLSLSPFTISVVQTSGRVTVTFDSVPNAENYKLYVNGVPIASATTGYFSYDFVQNGEYTIQCRAFANGYKFSRSDMHVVIVDVLGTFLSTLGKYLTVNFKRILIKR